MKKNTPGLELGFKKIYGFDYKDPIFQAPILFIPKKKKNRNRNWNIYNNYQTQERKIFLKVLDDLVESLNIKEQYKGRGRKPHRAKDMIKAICIKVFNDISARRCMTDIELAHAKGILTCQPSWNSLIDFYNTPKLGTYFKRCYKKVAALFVDVEKFFAVDGTGMSAHNLRIWRQTMTFQIVKDPNSIEKSRELMLDAKEIKYFKKLHIAAGYCTGIIADAKITQGNVHDSNCYQDVVNESIKIFNITEISADKAYLSREIVQFTADLGITPYIMPKKNTMLHARGSPAWNKMIWLWRKNEPLFRSHYHRRSNVESVFSALKTKFSGFLRNKTETAQENEILAKIVCHNICVLIRALYELKMEYPNFNPKK